jgi:hypothetical protein
MVENTDYSNLENASTTASPRSWRAPSASQDASWSPRLRLWILAPLALFLVWEVITRSVVAYLANANPELALRLRANYPTAFLKLAYDRLSRDPSAKKSEPVEPLPREDLTIVAKGMQSAKDIDLTVRPNPLSGDSPLSTATDSRAMAQIRSWVERALLEDPLNARALRILGQLSRGTSEAALMQAAARRSLLESEAVFWVMRKSYEDGDYRSASRYAEILLRTRPSSQTASQAAMAVLGRIAETPAASGELKQLLASNPRWRSQFFMLLPASVTDARAPLDLLLALKDTPTPPTTSEVGPYLKLLIEHEFYDLAYYTWLQFLPREQLDKAGYLFNGSFEVDPTGLPFDWKFAGESGATMEIADRTDGKGAHALFLEFGVGRVEGLSVSQMVILAPGDYQFRGTYKADIVSQRGLQWRVVCGKSGSVIGESPMIIDAKAEWRDFKFSFTVPDSDCSLQSVQLAFTARSASEQFISGSAWFDDLQIVREKIADREPIRQ